LETALVVSLLLHGGGIYAAERWGTCFCRIGKVVCPKLCDQQRVNLVLKAPPPPAPRPEAPRPVIQKPEPVRPVAAPKRGRVVLPDEAFTPRPQPRSELTMKAPSLPKEMVVKQSETEVPLLADPGLMARADELTPGRPGEYGLGGSGEGLNPGSRGTTERGSDDAATQPIPPSKPLLAHSPPPEPPKPKGPTRPPKPLDWADPPYPQQARQQGVEGVVVVKLTVDAQGNPQKVRVGQSSGYAILDEAAVTHVARTRFSPGIQNGESVPAAISFRVRFRLTSG
jgi:TonB family protein